jgi:hypothetical protein
VIDRLRSQIRHTRLFCGVEETQVLRYISNPDLGLILLITLAPVVPSRVAKVELVLLVRHDPQVFSLVVERVVVFVVALSLVTTYESENLPVHLYRCPSPIGQSLTPQHIIALRVRIPRGIPFPLHQPFVVGVINKGLLVVCQGDLLHGMPRGNGARPGCYG